MYLFFLIFFIFVSLSLIFLILLQPGKGLNNTLNSNTTSNIKLFNNIGTNSFITNIISVLSFLFLIISIVLCNINNRKMDVDFFLEDNKKNITKHESILEKKSLNLDIPH
ncbi:MAG: preprotein translocase subunit SecG [Buchnera aphidicola (Brevicoryne brassicae)]|uniref:Protein-export membrane protein SecG n=1 Tax=Buchnera aphidicola (Brevicoryne brassicae) TaxID=911343 RepID=A0AAJ5PVB9_9GAMM|nr:preprotein translocase subunit SecG [Buchnera aphidicola]QCI19940.1 preprotein translocase subunit SecG [Buchnera aphidicola (Brevicoryne brassicae)]WAI18763.1 MAG: preprotein translocase subunit SecG [Buchnera aphidicola (Brevicoryne brassicae)]